MKKTLVFLFVSMLALGVFVSAEDSANTGTDDTNTGTKIRATISADSIACAKAAIEKREVAVKGGMDAYYTSRGTAFTARTSAFVAALSQATRKDVKTAIDAAWKTYKTSMQTAKKAKKTVIQGAWNTYRTDLKACQGDLIKVLKAENGKSDLND